MRAVVQTAYGDPQKVITVGQLPKPVPQDGEVLVRVRAASLHPDVWHVLTGRPYVLRLMGAGFRRPKNPVPGIDLAGVVEAVGPNAHRFRPGDEVFGECVRGHQWKNGGAFAEYAVVRQGALSTKPADLSFEKAAAVPTSGYIAVQGVRDQGKVQARQHVLVNGAGGGVGTFAVQLAKAWGAEVTAVDAGHKLPTLRSIGADHVIDCAREDFTRAKQPYDLIIDIPGNRPWRHLRRVVAPDGRYVLIGHDQYGARGRRWFGGIGSFVRLATLSLFDRRLRASAATGTSEDRMSVLLKLIEAGNVVPVVDQTFPLERIHDAVEYLETGRACGKIVITV